MRADNRESHAPEFQCTFFGPPAVLFDFPMACCPERTGHIGYAQVRASLSVLIASNDFTMSDVKRRTVIPMRAAALYFRESDVMPRPLEWRPLTHVPPSISAARG